MADKLKKIERVVLICSGSDCKKHGAKDLRKACRKTCRALGIHRSTLVVRTRCTGHCKLGPIVALQPSNVWLQKADTETVRLALEEDFVRLVS